MNNEAYESEDLSKKDEHDVDDVIAVIQRSPTASAAPPSADSRHNQTSVGTPHQPNYDAQTSDSAAADVAVPAPTTDPASTICAVNLYEYPPPPNEPPPAYAYIPPPFHLTDGGSASLGPAPAYSFYPDGLGPPPGHAVGGSSSYLFPPDMRLEQQLAENPPHDYLSFSVINFLFCCWIFGLFAIVRSMHVRSALRFGDYEQAFIHSQSARLWNMAALVTGSLMWTFGIIAIVILCLI